VACNSCKPVFLAIPCYIVGVFMVWIDRCSGFEVCCGLMAWDGRSNLYGNRMNAWYATAAFWMFEGPIDQHSRLTLNEGTKYLHSTFFKKMHLRKGNYQISNWYSCSPSNLSRYLMLSYFCSVHRYHMVPAFVKFKSISKSSLYFLSQICCLTTL